MNEILHVGNESVIEKKPNSRLNFCVTTGSPERHLTHYSSHNVGNTTTLLLSEDGDMLYVGARDAVLALDVGHKDTIILKKRVGLPSVIEFQSQFKQENQKYFVQIFRIMEIKTKF